MRISLILSIILISFHLKAQVQDSTQAESWDQIRKEISKGKQYTIVFLKTGPGSAEQPPGQVEKQQVEHLKYLFSLKAQGKLPLFGPFLQSGDLRGICIFTSGDQAEVKKLIENDPHVKAGQLIYEMHPWFGIPGDRLPE